MAAPNGQRNWRFCTKCFGLFFNGFPGNGVCPVGGQHAAVAGQGGGGGTASWDYILIAEPVPYPEAE